MRVNQICNHYRLIIAVFVFLSLFAFCKQNAVAYTANNPVLDPANSLLVTNTPQPFTFSTANTTTSRMKTYHAEFTYTKGLNISNISATPTATTMTINTKQNKIIFEWTDIAPGTTLIGNFTATSITPGIYQITTANIYYKDYNRKTYTASCNTATITFRSELIPPLAPHQLSSIQGEGNIMLSWKYNTETDLFGYNIYRSSDAISFTKIGASQASFYTDTTVQANTTYYYRVTAYDIAGNESDFSPVTAETYFDLKLRTITATGVQAAVFGDFNADGKIDIAIGYPDAIVGIRKNAKASGKVEIYLGGNTTNIPDVVIPGENDKDDFGYTLAVADLDGDGYDDLVVGAPLFSPYLNWPVSGYAPGAGKIYVFRGALQFGSTPVLSINGQWSLGCNGSCYYMYAEEFGYSMSPVGDINGDGYQDIAIGAPMGGMDRSGTVKILLGGHYLEALSIKEIDGKVYFELMGQTLAAAGDINNDGYYDIIAAAPTDSKNSTDGKVYVILGGQQPSIVTSLVAGVINFGYSVASLDFNSDGNVDVASSASSFSGVLSSGIFINYGWPSGYSIADIVIPGELQKIFSLNGLTAEGYDALLTEGFSIYYGNLLGEAIADIVRNGVRVIGTDNPAVQSGGNLLVTDSTHLYAYTLAPYLTLPQITLSSPLRNMTVTEQMLNITGAVSGQTRQLLIQGNPVSVMSDGSFSANVLLDENSNTIEIFAITPDNRISKRTLSVTYAYLNPLTLTISMPSDGEIINASPVQVAGTISDPTALITINGVPATVSGQSYSAHVSLSEGSQIISVIAKDSYGRIVSKSVSVTLLTKGSVQGTVTEATTGQPLPGVTVMVTDSIASQTVITDSIGKYTVADLVFESFTSTFSKSGYITQTVSSTISSGQVLTLNVQLSPIPPLTISITSPLNSAVLNSAPITVTGNVTNNADVTVNGIQATVNGNTFTASVPLIEGPNGITASAIDQYAQTASQNITVNLILPKPPVISNLTVSNVDIDSAVISWTTDQPSDSLVNYGETTAYGNIASDAGLVTSHTITLNNLSPDKTYHFKVTSKNTYNYSSSSADQTFTTPIPSPSSISNVTVSNITYNSVVISWTTDQPTSTVIEYGTTTTYGSSVSDSALITNHSVQIQNLTSGMNYHFKIIATNAYASSSISEDNTLTTLSPITITIISPVSNETINRSDVIVKGTISNTTGNETGVTVNGIVTTVYGSQFIANNVPLTEDQNTITVTATDTSGNTISKSLSVNAVATGKYIRLTSNIESGIPPLQVLLRIDGSFSITASDISVTGPGAVEFLPGTLVDEYEVRMTTEGVYYFTAIVTGPDNIVYEDTVAIVVLNKNQLDTLLKGKWEGMKGALVNQDVSGAVSYFGDESKQVYMDIFTALYSQLPQLIQNMQNIQLIYTQSGTAIYRIRQNELYGGQMVTMTYHIYFTIDSDGIWKIYRY